MIKSMPFLKNETSYRHVYNTRPSPDLLFILVGFGYKCVCLDIQLCTTQYVFGSSQYKYTYIELMVVPVEIQVVIREINLFITVVAIITELGVTTVRSIYLNIGPPYATSATT